MVIPEDPNTPHEEINKPSVEAAAMTAKMDLDFMRGWWIDVRPLSTVRSVTAARLRG